VNIKEGDKLLAIEKLEGVSEDATDE
jgi:hypothetical protein